MVSREVLVAGVLTCKLVAGLQMFAVDRIARIPFLKSQADKVHQHCVSFVPTVKVANSYLSQ